jgi:hypothetical protein
MKRLKTGDQETWQASLDEFLRKARPRAFGGRGTARTTDYPRKRNRILLLTGTSLPSVTLQGGDQVVKRHSVGHRVASKSRKKRLCRLLCGKPLAFRRRQPPSSPRLGWKASLPAEPRGLVRAEALGKAKPFRKAAGRPALGCYLSRTLTRRWVGQSLPPGSRSTPACAPLAPDGVEVSRRKKAQRLANGEHWAAAMVSKCSSRLNPQPPLRCERWKPSAPACGDRCGERDKRLQSRLPRLPPRYQQKAACYPRCCL